MTDDDRRRGEDRREQAVSHETLYVKLIEHDDAIHEIRGDLSDLKGDVHTVAEQMEPIASGITTMVVLFKLILAVGALCAAFLGIFEFMEHFK